MKRKTKNIIIITLIIILGIASGFTIKLAKDSVSTNSNNIAKNMETPPEQGSPSIYSTAGITVKDATLVAKVSEGIVIEGANTVTIENCDLTDSNTKLNGQSTTYKNIFLYQSMSGDASNGGNVTLKMTNQKAEGNIVIDSISTLDMEMAESSYYEGTINGANEAKSITLKLDSTSKIKLTGDSYVTSLEDADATYSNIDFNGYKLYVNGVAIN